MVRAVPDLAGAVGLLLLSLWLAYINVTLSTSIADWERRVAERTAQLSAANRVITDYDNPTSAPIQFSRTFATASASSPITRVLAPSSPWSSPYTRSALAEVAVTGQKTWHSR